MQRSVLLWTRLAISRQYCICRPTASLLSPLPGVALAQVHDVESGAAGIRQSRLSEAGLSKGRGLVVAMSTRTQSRLGQASSEWSNDYATHTKLLSLPEERNSFPVHFSPSTITVHGDAWWACVPPLRCVSTTPPSCTTFSADKGGAKELLADSVSVVCEHGAGWVRDWSPSSPQASRSRALALRVRWCMCVRAHEENPGRRCVTPV
jgi:hypothetical protein